MSRLDRLFADYRAQVARAPITRANTRVHPQMALPNGVYMGLSLNK